MIACLNMLGRVSILALCLFLPRPAIAADPVLQFDQMPVGMQAHYKGSNSQYWVEIYRGRRDGLHVMERRRGSAFGEVVYEQFFNAAGHEVRRDFASGKVRHFVPHHCQRVLGECTYRLGKAKSARSGTGQLHRRGADFHFDWQPEGGALLVRSKYRVGKYGLISYLRSNDMLLHLVEIVE